MSYINYIPVCIPKINNSIALLGRGPRRDFGQRNDHCPSKKTITLKGWHKLLPSHEPVTPLKRLRTTPHIDKVCIALFFNNELAGKL